MSTFAAGVFGSNVDTVAAQDLVADSLVSDPKEGTSLGSVSELYARTEAANARDENGLYPDDYPQEAEPQEAEAREQEEPERNETAAAAVKEFADEQRNEMAEQLADEQVQQTPPTTAEVLIEKYELVGDPEQQQELVSGFAEVFGGDAQTIDGKALESMTARTGLDMALYYKAADGNPERARALSEQELSTVGSNFKAGLFDAFSVDKRLMQGNPQADAYLGDWVINRAWAIVDAYQKNGHAYDVAQINTSRNAAVQGFGEFLYLSGVSVPEITAIIAANPSLPLRAADWFAKSILAPVDKLTKSGQSQQPTQRRAAQQGSKRQSRPNDSDDPMERFSHSRGKKIPGMESHSDLFDLEALELYKHDHPRL